MFRAVHCSSSGGQIVLFITASGIVTLCKRPYSMPVERGRSPLSTGILYGRLQSCNNTICPPEDEHSTARNMLRIDYTLITNLMH